MTLRFLPEPTAWTVEWWHTHARAALHSGSGRQSYFRTAWLAGWASFAGREGWGMLEKPLSSRGKLPSV
jgi:hypothetical protein